MPVAWICLNAFSQQVESPDASCQTASVSHRSCAPLSLQCPLLPFSLSGFTSFRLVSELRNFLLSVPVGISSGALLFCLCYISIPVRLGG